MTGKTANPTNKVGAVTGTGNRGRGRPKGSRNKVTIAAKEAISLAFDELGGTDELVKWAKLNDDNRKVFYSQIWTKIIPLQVNGAGEDGSHVHEIIMRGVSPS